MIHVTEPEYQKLIDDIERKKLPFGVLNDDDINTEKFGSMVLISKILNRYPDGDIDLIVKCIGVFKLEKFYENFMEIEPYPGGVINYFPLVTSDLVSEELLNAYNSFAVLNNTDPICMIDNNVTLFKIAQKLKMDVPDKIRFVKMKCPSLRRTFLHNQIKYKKAILKLEEKSKYHFHLN